MKQDFYPNLREFNMKCLIASSHHHRIRPESERVRERGEAAKRGDFSLEIFEIFFNEMLKKSKEI